MTDEASNATSQRNELNIRRMILMGESEIVKMKRARGIPNAKKAQPKNSAIVIVSAYHSIFP
jgi:hypothetical protein